MVNLTGNMIKKRTPLLPVRQPESKTFELRLVFAMVKFIVFCLTNTTSRKALLPQLTFPTMQKNWLKNLI